MDHGSVASYSDDVDVADTAEYGDFPVNPDIDGGGDVAGGADITLVLMFAQFLESVLPEGWRVLKARQRAREGQGQGQGASTFILSPQVTSTTLHWPPASLTPPSTLAAGQSTSPASLTPPSCRDTASTPSRG